LIELNCKDEDHSCIHSNAMQLTSFPYASKTHIARVWDVSSATTRDIHPRASPPRHACPSRHDRRRIARA
jgi:hypothetical protein